MGLMPAAFKAAIRSGRPCVALLEIDLPTALGGTVRLGEKAGVWSDEGWYEGRVVSFGRLQRSAGDLEGGLESITAQVRIDDQDLWWRRDVLVGNPRHSAVRIYYAIANDDGTPRPKTEWFQLYGGRLDDWQPAGRNAWTLMLQPPDQLLSTTVPRKRVLGSLFPNCPQANLNALIPIIAGRHDHEGRPTARSGAITCIQVDSSREWWLVSHGRQQAVPRVYQASSTPMSSGYSVTYPIIGGEQLTLIDLSSTATATVTCDVRGTEATGDGTGALVVGFVGTLRHVLNNYVLGTYSSGAYAASDNSLIDTTSWDACQTALAGIAGGASPCASINLSSETTGLQIINDHLRGTPVRAFWTNLGKLALKLDSRQTRGTAVYGSAPWYQETDEQGDTWRIKPQTARIVGELDTTYGDGQQSLTLIDPLADETTAEPLSWPHGPEMCP